jgi:hypothetical protein
MSSALACEPQETMAGMGYISMIRTGPATRTAEYAHPEREGFELVYGIDCVELTDSITRKVITKIRFGGLTVQNRVQGDYRNRRRVPGVGASNTKVRTGSCETTWITTLTYIGLMNCWAASSRATVFFVASLTFPVKVSEPGGYESLKFSIPNCQSAT